MGSPESITPPPGGQVYNVSVDREMTYYPVSEMELKAIGRASTFATVCFTVFGITVSIAIGAARDAMKQGATPADAAAAWAWAFGIVAVVFLVFGIVQLVDRSTILKELRATRKPK